MERYESGRLNIFAIYGIFVQYNNSVYNKVHKVYH